MNSVSVINTLKTMTSREIAELTGKRHDHVMRDARQMLEEIGSPQNWGELPDSYGRPQPVLLLDKEQSLCLVAGYSAPLRMAIIRRWQDLEAQQQIAVPTTLSGALRLAAEQAEMIEKQAAQLEAAKPAIAFSERHQDATNLMSIRAAAKVMKFKEARLIDCLLRDKLLYRDRQHRLVPYASSQHEKQVFDCVTGEANGHAYAQTKVTTYGVQYLSNRYASELGE